jgi:hypothetical protein
MSRIIPAGVVTLLALGSYLVRARGAEHTTDPLPAVRNAVAAGTALLVDVREK